MEEIFGIAKAALFDGLELLLDDNIANQGTDFLRSLTTSHIMPIRSVHAPLDNSQVFGEAADIILSKTKRLATVLGVSKVIVHPYRHGDPQYIDAISQLLTDMEQPMTKPTVLIENMPKQVKSIELPATIYEPRELIAQFREICLDTSHLATTGLELQEITKACQNKIGHVHLSDSNLIPIGNQANEDEHLAPGTGKLPLAWFVKTLQLNGYSGDYCIELRPARLKNLSRRELINDLKQITHRVKSWIAESQE